jgi:hypothetical protein
MNIINEFIILRLKVYEICLIFHKIMPDDYEYINLNDISISLDTELMYISVRNNSHFDSTEYIGFGSEWLNMSNFAIIKIAKKLKYLTKD